MDQAVELLLVEDNPSDVELTLHVLKKHSFCNRIKVVRDGAAALDFFVRFRRQKFRISSESVATITCASSGDAETAR